MPAGRKGGRQTGRQIGKRPKSFRSFAAAKSSNTLSAPKCIDLRAKHVEVGRSKMEVRTHVYAKARAKAKAKFGAR